MDPPSNILNLAAKNQALLERVGFTPGKDDPLELCTPDVYRRTGLFSEATIIRMFSGADSKDQGTANSVRNIARNIGMILVRPDMIHATDQFERFIANRFSIIDSRSVLIDSVTYWNLYRHDFYRRETMHSRLTRAALYIGSYCRLIVFRSPEVDPKVPVADYARGPLKGQQGQYHPGTLRGDVVYRNAVALGLHRLADPELDERLKIATDPFMAFRTLAGDPAHPCRLLHYPLLFFTGVGVHIPDYAEIGNVPQFVDVAQAPYRA